MPAAGLLYGFHPIAARLRAAPESIEIVYLDATRTDARMRDLERLAAGKGVQTARVDAKRLDGLAGADARHQGVVAKAVAWQPKWGSLDDRLDALAEPPLVLALDGVTDPHNFGAVLRTADGAGVHAVIAPKDRSAGLSAVAIKAASGAAESVPYFVVPNLARAIDELKERRIWVLGLADEAERSLYAPDLDLAGPTAFVLGAEGSGLRRLTRERCDALVSIPMAGAVGSLNVSVAAGVCLFEARRRRLKNG